MSCKNCGKEAKINRIFCSRRCSLLFNRSFAKLDSCNKRYNWELVQLDMNSNISNNKICKKYGFTRSTFEKALRTGRIHTDVMQVSTMSFSQYCQHIEGRLANSNIRWQLKKKLLKEGIIKECCAICGIIKWNGKKICFDLDHIDGDGYNNAQINLRLLCPNCHSQTETWRGRNTKKAKLKRAIVNLGVIEGNTVRRSIVIRMKMGASPIGHP